MVRRVLKCNGKVLENDGMYFRCVSKTINNHNIHIFIIMVLQHEQGRDFQPLVKHFTK